MSDLRSDGFGMAPRAVLGLIIIAVGLLLTAGNVGWLDPDEVWRVLRYWPLGLVVLGAVKIVVGRDRSSRLTGSLLAALGLWVLAQQMYDVRIHLSDWWPILLIGFGILVISRAWRGGGFGSTRPDQGMSEFAFWSGVERRVTSSAFKGATLTAIMGGIELDLRPAATATGEAVIDVFALMGGVEITVPPDWVVSNHILAIMGGSEDKSAGAPDARHRLILRGVVVMGGVEIKT